MAYFKQKTNFSKIFFSRGMAMVLLVMIFFVGYGLVNIIGKSIDVARERDSAQKDEATLKAKEADLSQKIDDLKTPDGEEAALRSQFPVVKVGEHVVVITDPTTATTTDTQVSPTATQPASSGGFWNFLKNLFK